MKDSMEYLLRNLPQSERAKLKKQSLGEALAKMTPREQVIIEEAVLRLSRIKGVGRISSLEVLSAVGRVLRNYL